MICHEGFVRQPFVEDDANHAQEQGRIGSGSDRHPFVGFSGGGREVRVYGDHLRAGLFGFEEHAYLWQGRFAEIAAYGKNEFGINPIARVSRRSGIASAVADCRVQAIANAHVDTREASRTCAQDGCEET